jgi:hypothetical protein
MSGQGEPKCLLLTVKINGRANVAVQLAPRCQVGFGRSFGQKPNLAMVSVSTTTTSSDVVNFLTDICWDASCLFFDFSGENLLRLIRGARWRLLRRVILGGAALEITLICFT